MRPLSKLSALIAVLVADLLFFLFIGVYYPEVLEFILKLLPWEDSLERMIIILSGFIIAVASSFAIISIVIRGLQRVMSAK